MGQELIMARSILLDTDILVDFFRGQSKAVAFVNAHSARIILSSIVVAELYAGVKGDAEQAALDNFVSLFRVVPVSGEIAKAGGLYKRDYGKSYGVGLADAILAATVEAENAELKTLNTKHYPMLKGLRPAYMKRRGI
jgi:predicted nucleic acid-binding protein